MSITFELPGPIEKSLRESFADLNHTAKEAALVELYRQHKLTHHELAQSLGLSRAETDAVLKRHDVHYETSFEEICQESKSLRSASNP